MDFARICAPPFDHTEVSSPDSFGAIQAGNVFSFVPDISSAKGAAEDMLRLMDSNPEIDAEAVDGKVIDEATGHIELRDIHFRYRTCGRLWC